MRAQAGSASIAAASLVTRSVPDLAFLAFTGSDRHYRPGADGCGGPGRCGMARDHNNTAPARCGRSGPRGW